MGFSRQECWSGVPLPSLQILKGGLSNEQGQEKASHRVNRVNGGVCWGGPSLMPPEPGGKSGRPWPQEPGCGGACGKRDRSRFKRAFDGDGIRWALCKCCSDYRVENWRGT